MARCHWAKEPLVHLWRQSSHVILAAFLDFLLQLLKVASFSDMLHFPTGLRMLYVRCDVFLANTLKKSDRNTCSKRSKR